MEEFHDFYSSSPGWFFGNDDLGCTLSSKHDNKEWIDSRLNDHVSNPFQGNPSFVQLVPETGKWPFPTRVHYNDQSKGTTADGLKLSTASSLLFLLEFCRSVSMEDIHWSPQCVDYTCTISKEDRYAYKFPSKFGLGARLLKSIMETCTSENATSDEPTMDAYVGARFSYGYTFHRECVAVIDRLAHVAHEYKCDQKFTYQSFLPAFVIKPMWWDEKNPRSTSPLPFQRF